MITERGFVDERSRYIHEFTGQLCRWDQQGTVELAGLYELVPPLPRYRDLDALEFSWYLCRCDSLLAVNHRRVLNLQGRLAVPAQADRVEFALDLGISALGHKFFKHVLYALGRILGHMPPLGDSRRFSLTGFFERLQELQELRNPVHLLHGGLEVSGQRFLRCG